MRVTAAAVVGVAVAVALGTSAATARADVQCTGSDGPNPLGQPVYQLRYDSTVAKPLIQNMKFFNAAISTAEPARIGAAAGLLSSQVATAPMMFGTQSPFGCYSAAVLTTLQQATSAFASSLDGISGAAASLDGRTPSDVATLVVAANSQESAYIDAVNAYAAQFGGQQVPKPEGVLQGLPG
jgi:hypothetical protein